jgi:hypothetical protein
LIWIGFLLVWITISANVYAQDEDWSLIASIQVENLDLLSVDNRGNIFFSDESGNVEKLGPNGEMLGRYSPILQARLDQLEAFHTVNIFLFSFDLQQFVILDVFLNPISSFDLRDEGVGIVKAATLGNNNILWLFDEVDLSLIQYDYRRSLVLQKQPLSLILGSNKMEVVELIERQNMIFMNVKDKGIIIFDNQGNLIKELDIQVDQKLNIYGNSIYFINKGMIQYVNIFSEEKREYKLPDASYRNLKITSERVLFYSSTSIDIYDQPGFQ